MTIRLSDMATRVPGSGIRRIHNLARQKPGVISFTLGEPDFDTPPHILEAGTRALRDGWTRYTPNAGTSEFREAVATKVQDRNSMVADPESEIMATQGAMGALSLAVQCIAGPGDEVLIPDPGYVSYEAHVLMAGATPVRVPVLEADEFVVGPEAIEASLSGRTRTLILNSPANPTGAAMDGQQIEAVCELVRANDLAVISDEVYERILYDGREHYSIAAFDDMRERVVTVFSLSKTYAMTGWRIGYAVGPAPVIAAMTRMQEHVAAHPAAVSQVAATTALAGPQDCVDRFVSEFDRRRECCCRGVSSIPELGCIRPHGAFYVMANISRTGMDSRQAAMFLLDQAGVATVPGVEFGPTGEGYLRLSYAMSEEKIEAGLAGIAKALADMHA